MQLCVFAPKQKQSEVYKALKAEHICTVEDCVDMKKEQVDVIAIGLEEAEKKVNRLSIY